MKEEKMASLAVLDSARHDKGLGAIRRCRLPYGPELAANGMRTLWEVFRNSVETHGERPCLGRRAPPETEDGEAGDFVWLTYAETHRRAIAFGNGLDHLDLCRANADGMRLLGILAKNQPEYMSCELGGHSKRIIPVPLYDTLGPDAVEFIVGQTELDTVICESKDVEETLLKNDKLKEQLRAIILLDDSANYPMEDARLEELKRAGKEAGIAVYGLRAVEALGREHESPLELPSGHDIATFCYSSGTTGDPKGCLILHSGLISAIASLGHFGISPRPDDFHLSYLPMAHIFERAITFAILMGGGAIGFSQGDPRKIPDDIVKLRPTVFPTVPRLLNRMHDKIWGSIKDAKPLQRAVFEQALQGKLERLHEIGVADKVAALVANPGVSDWLFEKALAEKLDDIKSGRAYEAAVSAVTNGIIPEVKEAGGINSWLFTKAKERRSAAQRDKGAPSESEEAAARTLEPGRDGTDSLQQPKLAHGVYDRVVFGKLKKRLGLDRCRVIAVGSAPISGEVLDFFRVVLSIPVLNAYGATESSCVISLSLPEDTTTGHVGVPIPANEVRLVSVPDMGYSVEDTEHEGAPCMGRGEICFRGANVFSGYYKMPEKTAETIDEDRWCYTGDIGIWTADGKLKVVDRKKNLFKLAHGEYVAPEKIENALGRADLIASVFVYGDSEEAFLVAIVVPDHGALQQASVDVGDEEQVRSALERALDEQSKSAGLRGFEKVRAFHVEEKQFADIEGLTTPTQKLKRNVAADHYKDVIEDLYKQAKK